MAPFSILRRSPRGRKGNEEQNSGDDVKTAGGAPLPEAHQHDVSPAAIGPKDTDDGETTSKGRRGFNKDLLHSIRSRFAGKLPSSSTQRGTSQPRPQKQDAAAAVGIPHSPIPSIPSTPTLMHYNLLLKLDATAACGGTQCQLPFANGLRRTCAARRLWRMAWHSGGRREPSPVRVVEAGGHG